MTYNWDIIGHQKVINHLQTSIEQGNLAHAYIFSGPAHLGKKLVVEKFIASILCSDNHQGKKDVIPCKECIPCKQLEKNIHPDVYWFKRAEDKNDIIIEQIRELKDKLSLSSFLNSYKIAVIEDADKMNENAQNALLKILEEPAKKTILILMTNDASLLLPTIISRCRLIKFHRVKTVLIYDYLLAQGATREQAKNLSQLSEGLQGLALDYFKNGELFEAHDQKVKKFLEILKGDLVEKFNLADSLVEGESYAENSNEVADNLAVWQSVLRDMVFVKIGLDDYMTHYYCQTELKAVSLKYTLSKLLIFIKNIDQIKRYLERNVNLKLALENLVLAF